MCKGEKTKVKGLLAEETGLFGCGSATQHEPQQMRKKIGCCFLEPCDCFGIALNCNAKR